MPTREELEEFFKDEVDAEENSLEIKELDSKEDLDLNEDLDSKEN